MPGIYDYKAAFAQNPKHLFGQDMNEFVQANQQEIETIDADFVVCGYDIYNIEAEAIGCRVNRLPNCFPDVAEPLIHSCQDVSRLPDVVEPLGRIALFLEAARILQERNRGKTIVMGAVSGPFSLAGKLYAQDRLLMDCLADTQGVEALMHYCTEIIEMIVTQYCRQHTPVVVFDSLAAPPLVSPDVYRQLVLPFHQRIFQTMVDMKMAVRPLIIGGDTRVLLDDYTNTGANLLLLDFTIPVSELPSILERFCGAFRINLSPQTIAEGSLEDIEAATLELLKMVSSYPNVILGTGILPVHTPPINITHIKTFLQAYWESRSDD